MSRMRLALQHERSSQNNKIIAKGKSTISLNLFVQGVFALDTIKGPRAIQIEDKLGSIEAGELADLAIFDGNGPRMICATEEGPVAAIVLHSSVGDVDTVIVDSEIRKQDGKLLPTTINPSFPDMTIPRQTVGWSQVVRELVSSGEKVKNARMESNADDSEFLTAKFMKLMHLDEAKFVRMS